MSFDSRKYGTAVAGILALDGDGNRLMPLTQAPICSPAAWAALGKQSAADLMPAAPSPKAALAGLYFYFNCWREAHETAQDLSSREGSYWHALVHRQEPDSWNSGYWFRQTGAHPIFPALRNAAAELGVDFGPKWKPEALIDFCDRARAAKGSEIERQALEVQRIEWQLLFDYCAAV